MNEWWSWSFPAAWFTVCIVIRKYFTLGGCAGTEIKSVIVTRNISLWEDVVVLEWELLSLASSWFGVKLAQTCLHHCESRFHWNWYLSLFQRIFLFGRMYWSWNCNIFIYCTTIIVIREYFLWECVSVSKWAMLFVVVLSLLWVWNWPNGTVGRVSLVWWLSLGFTTDKIASKVLILVHICPGLWQLYWYQQVCVSCFDGPFRRVWSCPCCSYGLNTGHWVPCKPCLLPGLDGTFQWNQCLWNISHKQYHQCVWLQALVQFQNDISLWEGVARNGPERKYFACYYNNNNINVYYPFVHFLGGLSLHLNHLYTVAHGHLLLAIWDTSHWTSFVKFGLKTAWGISYDILWLILKYVNFWLLQGCSNTFGKILGLQKINFFSMKERHGFNKAWGFRWAGP